MIDTEIFDLLYNHLEERSYNNVRSQLDTDTNYQNAMEQECEFSQQYESLDLPKEQCQIIEKWVDAISARDGAYAEVVFRMGMQFCFSLMMQLADLK